MHRSTRVRRFAVGAICLGAVGAGVPVLAQGDAASGPSAAPRATAAAGGQAEAKRLVTKYSKTVPLKVKALSKRPPRGKSIVELNCTLPICVNGALRAPAQALGWKYKNIPFDITKGPAALAAGMAQAVQAKPDYIITIGFFPSSVIASQLDDARKAGIKVAYITGNIDNPAISFCVNCRKYLLKVGALQADLMVSKIGVDAPTVSAGDRTLLGTEQEFAGRKAELARLGAKPATELNLPSANSPAASASTVINYLQRNPSVKGVFSNFSDQLQGMPAAAKSVGLTGKVNWISAAPKKLDEDFIRSGDMLGAVVMESKGAWWRVADTFARMSIKAPYAKEPSDWASLLTKANFGRVLKSNGNPPEPTNYQSVYKKAWKVG